MPVVDEVICGETIDHDEHLTYEDEDMTQWTCDRCGAEWQEDAE